MFDHDSVSEAAEPGITEEESHISSLVIFLRFQKKTHVFVYISIVSICTKIVFV